MITSALVALLLMQSPALSHWSGVFDSPRPDAQDRFPAEVGVVRGSNPVDTEDSVLKERRFAASFNHLLSTLQDFSESYNAGGKVDLKKVAAIKKAWRQLEMADPWFKLEKNKLERTRLDKSKAGKDGVVQ